MKDYMMIIAADAARISVEYSKKMGITEDEALRIFLGSTTYRVLVNAETGLCYEVFESIYEMFLEEMGVQ
jgi:hypothetical protein